MSNSKQIEGAFSAANGGLDDRSEEVSERTEAEAQIRFYRAMADTEADYGRVLTELARAVSEVIFDLCVVYLIDEEQEGLDSAAAYHPHPQSLQSLHETFAGTNGGVGAGLVRRVIDRQESYFRPRWRPSLLRAHNPENKKPDLDLAIHSLIVVPMVTTDGDCLGALLAGRHTTSLSYDETDLALTEWIASHAAMKLETAQLYRDLRQTNERLDAAVQARDTFISIASHELRTPLSTLKLHAQILQRSACKDPDSLTPKKVIPKLDSISHQVDHLDRLVDQLLNVSRITDGGLDVTWRRCNLASVVSKVAGRFAYEIQQAGSELTIDCDEPLIGLWDPERLDHVTTNLLSNALKYGDGNPISIAMERDGETAILEVTDRGDGIPAAARQKIFERFERAVDNDRRQGLGLGLWIVREYVESLDGVIEVDSTPGQGSTFRVLLPIEPESAPRQS